MNPSEPIIEDHSFLSEIIAASGVNLQACYQCQKCSAGCPVVDAMDLLPNQVLRHIQYGHRERVLGSKTIWICASCYTCSVRCPNDIDIAKIMDTLRHLAIRSGSKPGEKDIPLFHSLFLEEIKSKGRIHELSLILQIQIEDKRFPQRCGAGVEDVSTRKDQTSSFHLPRRQRDQRDFQRL